MYKQIFIIHKSENDKALSHIRDVIIKHFKEITGKEIPLAKVENNLLLDQKYSYCFEVEFESKDKMNELMNTGSGRKLTKALLDFHQMITVITLNYETSE